MIPFNPQSIDELKERYPKAIVKMYDMEAVELGTALGIGRKAEHYFDWPEGIRMMISREDCVECGECIHVSASLCPNSDLFNRLRSTTTTQDEAVEQFKKVCEERFHTLADNDWPVLMFRVTSDDILHWRFGPPRPKFNIDMTNLEKIGKI